MAAPENPEDRLTRLEENAVFQERALDELNSALTAQQRQVDDLERRLERAENLIRLLRDELTQAGGGTAEVSPHYQFVK